MGALTDIWDIMNIFLRCWWTFFHRTFIINLKCLWIAETGIECWMEIISLKTKWTHDKNKTKGYIVIEFQNNMNHDEPLIYVCLPCIEFLIPIDIYEDWSCLYLCLWERRWFACFWCHMSNVAISVLYHCSQSHCYTHLLPIVVLQFSSKAVIFSLWPSLHTLPHGSGLCCLLQADEIK